MAQTQTLKSTALQPLGNRVLLRRLEAETTARGGIILPDSAKKKQEQAEVIAVGTGKKDSEGKTIPMTVKVGDIVLMEKYSGQEVTINDEEFFIVRSEEIIAIIEK